jgi:hypothetical protein
MDMKLHEITISEHPLIIYSSAMYQTFACPVWSEQLLTNKAG